ncbi:hypothetical protein CR513_57499, partial [Mucuna pruriens]
MQKRRTTKKKGKQVPVMDSSHSYSPNNLSESWDCPPSARKHLIPDFSVVSTRRASLRLANKFIETRTKHVHANQVQDSNVSYARGASLRSAKKLSVTRTTSVQANQVSECSVAKLESPPTQILHPSTFALEIRHEETDKVGDSVAPQNYSIDVAEMANHSIQMEEHNAFEAQCIPLELKPLAENIQASSNSRERADNNNSKSISMVGHSSSRFSLNLTEMVNMWDNEGDEVNSVEQRSSMDTVEGYQVKPKFMAILRKILIKHGDVFQNSLVSTMTFRSIFLEVICDIISELQDKGLHKIKEDELQNMIGLANEMKNMKVNIEWLHLRLEEILEARQILEQSGMLKEKKDSNKKVIDTVKRELEHCEAEKKTLEAKFRSLCDKENACKEALARAQDECAMISQTITYAKSKSESWECPPYERKSLIPDSSILYDPCLDSLRSAKKFIETRITSVQAYQVPQCSAVGLDSPPRQVAPLSTFTPQIRHRDTEKVEHSGAVAPQNCSIYVTKMAEDIQASSNSKEKAYNNNSKSISMFEHSSSHFSLNHTEMVNMWDNECDEVNSVGQSSSIDTVEVEGYQVRPEVESILRKILTKHGDVFKNSTVSTMIFRSMLLEMVCDIISELQDKDLHKITEDELHSMLDLASEMKNMKVNIEWLHLRLEDILEARQILKQSGMLKEKKHINKKIVQTVERELEVCEAEKKAVEAKFQSLCDKESACKEALARAEDECVRICQTMTYAKSQLRHFVNCSLMNAFCPLTFVGLLLQHGILVNFSAKVLEIGVRRICVKKRR